MKLKLQHICSIMFFVSSLLYAESAHIMIQPEVNYSSAYNGYDLITNMPQQNMDLSVLNYRQAVEKQYIKKYGEALDYYFIPSASLGGFAYVQRPFIGTANKAIQLYVAEFTALAVLNRWTAALASFDYDANAPKNSDFPGVGIPIGSTSFYFDQAFLTIGNFDLSPFHLSVGEMYSPFGLYNSFMINSPLTASLFVIETPAMKFGYVWHQNDDVLNIQLFAYHGGTVTNPNTSYALGSGMSVNYFIARHSWQGNLGFAITSNIADSDGMEFNDQFQANNNTTQPCSLFGGFAVSCQNSNVLEHKVPGIAVHADYLYDPWLITVEYISALRPFSPVNMTYNFQGARPSALDIEVNYDFIWHNQPSSAAIAYATTKQALALLLPTAELSFMVGTSFWRNTILKLGYQLDVNYPQGAEATGQMLPVLTPYTQSQLSHLSHTALLMMTVSF